jgi:hypothetical protein
MGSPFRFVVLMQINLFRMQLMAILYRIRLMWAMENEDGCWVSCLYDVPLPSIFVLRLNSCRRQQNLVLHKPLRPVGPCKGSQKKFKLFQYNEVERQARIVALFTISSHDRINGQGVRQPISCVKQIMPHTSEGFTHLHAAQFLKTSCATALLLMHGEQILFKSGRLSAQGFAQFAAGLTRYWPPSVDPMADCYAVLQLDDQFHYLAARCYYREGFLLGLAFPLSESLARIRRGWRI